MYIQTIEGNQEHGFCDCCKTNAKIYIENFRLDIVAPKGKTIMANDLFTKEICPACLMREIHKFIANNRK